MEFCHIVIGLENHLNDLDAAVGDGEHGSNLTNGAKTLIEKIPYLKKASLGEFFDDVGMIIINSVGGASGALYGTFFLRVSDITVGKQEADLTLLTRAFDSALAGIVELGRVKPGDKTLVDALRPAVDSLHDSVKNSETLLTAVTKAHYVAELGCMATANMEARKGRGSYQGDRSIGHIDPGATSMAALFGALSHTVGVHSSGN